MPRIYANITGCEYNAFRKFQRNNKVTLRNVNYTANEI